MERERRCQIPNGDYTYNNMLLLLCIYIKYMYNMYINSGGGAVKYGVCVCVQIVWLANR
jgi:hypothetical protein